MRAGATAAAMGTHFFGGLGVGLRRWEGRKRPAWPAELWGSSNPPAAASPGPKWGRSPPGVRPVIARPSCARIY